MFLKPSAKLVSLLCALSLTNTAVAAEPLVLSKDAQLAASTPTINITLPQVSLDPSKAEKYDRTPSVSDFPVGATITYSISNKPYWLRLNKTTGQLKGTPTFADAGSYTGIVITATATDADGTHTASTQPFTINVFDENGDFQLDKCYTDNFVGTGGLDDTWQRLKSKGYTPISTVVNGQSRLRLTDLATNRSTGVSKVFPIPAVGVNQFEFLAAAYGGNGADGIAFVLSDWDVEPKIGVQGHGLGYGTSGSTTGFAGGWLAVGIDEWGNFSDPGHHRSQTGPGNVKNSISIRGSGENLAGYHYIAGTNTLQPALDSNADGYLYRVTLDSTTKTEAFLTVERQINGRYITIIDRFDVLTGQDQKPLPSQFRVSFTGSTGANFNYHEVSLLTTTGSNCDNVSSIKIAPGVVDIANNVATFSVSLNEPAPLAGIEVDYATSDGTAKANSEYTSTANRLVFASGERYKTISVPLSALDSDDNDKDFFVRLSNQTSGSYIALGSASAKFKITASNNAPVGTPDNFELDQGRRLKGPSVLTNDTDADNDDLSAVLVLNPSNGTLRFNPDGTFVYQHNGANTNTDTFTYRVNDGQANSSDITVTIDINAVNEDILTDADIYRVNESATLTVLSSESVLSNDTHTDNAKSLTAVKASEPKHGTLTFNSDGTFTYVHDGSETTSDGFTYRANDGSSNSNTVNVVINITPVNDETPVAVKDDYTVNEGGTLKNQSVLTNDTDGDKDNIEAQLVTDVTNGSLTLNKDGFFVYTHNGSETTADSFEYKVTDGKFESSTVQVDITVTPVNDKPVANDDNGYVVTEGAKLDASTSVLTNDTDGDTDRSNFRVVNVSSPQHGTVAFNADGTFSYQHNGSENNKDTFTYKVNDGNSSSDNPATVTINVTPVNDAPVPVDDKFTASEGGALNGTTVLVNDTDAENDSLTAKLVTDTTSGTLDFKSDGTFSYQHNGSESTTDTFTYKVNDGKVDSTEVATVTITLSRVNDAPVAVNDSYAISEGARLTGTTVLANDTDVDSNNLTAKLVSDVRNGTLTLNSNGTFTYIHDDSETGSDSFTYKANDGVLDSNVATVNISISSVNDQLPSASPESYEVNRGATLNGASVLANDSDPEGDGLTAVLVSDVSNGTLTLSSNGSFVYVHNDSNTSSDSFSYKANDGRFDSNTVTVNISVINTNKAPLANDLEIKVNEDSSVRFQLTGSDPENAALTYTLVSEPEHGQLTGTAPQLSYTPNPDYNGADSFTYSVNDGELDSNLATVSITVEPVAEDNLPPVANDDEFNFDQVTSVTLDVLSNDTDPENDPLTLISAYSDFATVTVVDGQIAFTPEQNTSGRFSVYYSIADTAGNTATATALIDMSNSQGPVITLPQDLCGEFVVQANALHTRVELGQASAVDRFGNSVPVSVVDGVSLFPPGINEVFWSATDASGNTTVKAQRVCVMPLVSIEKDQTVLAGDAATVGVYLNGESPVYPVVVPFTVSGTATADDHDLVSGEVTIGSGTEQFISLTSLLNPANNDDKTVIIALSDQLNLGAKSQHQLLITDKNIAPQASLNVLQKGQQRLTVSRTDGVVEVTSRFQDPNLKDVHTLTWSASSDALTNLSEDDSKYRFDPANIELGLYQVTLQVTDSGSPQLSDNETVYIEVVDAIATFADPNKDSDGDLIPDVEEGYADNDGDGIPDYLDKIDECNVLQEQVANQDSYLVEGQPGVCLRRGQLSIGGETGGAEITAQDIANKPANSIVADSEAQNVGGVFDYIVYGLPEQGNNYAIVMPQKRPVPVNAVYRKFRPQSGWGFFIEDDNNSLWSTQGEPGHCPPPAIDGQDGVWQSGLTPGHWCVQQVIQDGGVNDDDGIVNGRIVDPGGVGVMLNSNHLPVATDDVTSLIMGQEITVDVLSNDSDEDGDELTITSATANFGEVKVENNKLYYQSSPSYSGKILIEYGITDNKGGTDHAVLTITMIRNLAPELSNENSEINQGQSVSINLLANDSDPESDKLTLVAVDNNNVSFNADGEAKFTPAADFYGTVTVNYTVTDTVGNRSQGQWQIKVIQVHQVSARTEGGGSISLWLLMLLATLFGYRYAHVRTKKG